MIALFVLAGLYTILFGLLNWAVPYFYTKKPKSYVMFWRMSKGFRIFLIIMLYLGMVCGAATAQWLGSFFFGVNFIDHINFLSWLK